MKNISDHIEEYKKSLGKPKGDPVAEAFLSLRQEFKTTLDLLEKNYAARYAEFTELCNSVERHHAEIQDLHKEWAREKMALEIRMKERDEEEKEYLNRLESKKVELQEEYSVKMSRFERHVEIRKQEVAKLESVKQTKEQEIQKVLTLPKIVRARRG